MLMNKSMKPLGRMMVKAKVLPNLRRISRLEYLQQLDTSEPTLRCRAITTFNNKNKTWGKPNRAVNTVAK